MFSGMGSSRRIRRLLRPTWGAFLIASAATLVLTYVQWETWTVTFGDDPDKFVDYYYYWPLLTHSHTDAVQPVTSAALTWNFFAGIALLYIPAALVDRLLQRASALGRAPDPFDRIVAVLAMRSDRALKTLAFALVASTLPPWPISVYSLPGLVGLALLEETVAASTPRYVAVAEVPIAFVFWYGAFTAGTVAVAILRERKG